jgi:serine/threonine-protein kinase
MLTSIERQLTGYVGPIAKVLVRSGIRKAASIRALCDLLAGSIDDEVQRRQFLSDTRQRIQQHVEHRTLLGTPQAGITERGAEPETIGPGITAIEMEAMARDLARFAGPIATILVRRAAKGAASRRDLRERLAEHISDREARDRFLADDDGMKHRG